MVPAPYQDHKREFSKKFVKKILAFFTWYGKLFYKEKIDKFHQIYYKFEWKNY